MFVAPRWLWPVAPLLVLAQQPGSLTPEKGPTISVKECSKAGCTQKDLHVTMDANWRWIHTEEGYENCYSGDSWDTTVCTDPGVCAKSCAVEGLDTSKYETTYGVTQIDGGVKLGFVTGSNVGSRLYLLEDENYKMFKLKNREFAVDVDASQVQCGMNGAMYFVEMDAAGGKGLGSNKAGAMYGTGYCDAQCPRDVKFMSGQANLDRSHGSCCAEMDIWEANNKATSYTAHPCKIDTAGPYICEGVDCADSGSGNELKGLCDKAGCDINPFRDGDTDFWGEGEGFVLDSSKKVTVVTQFITDDGTDAGDLVDIRRFYVQDGKVIESPSINIAPGSPASMTDQMCDEVKKVFENPNDFKAKGGLKAMGESLGRGHVATFSLWDDVSVRMMWLDSCFPTDLDCSAPGVHRGPCGGGDQSAPDFVRSHYGTGWVSYANVAFGEIGTTQQQYPGSPPAPAPTPQPQPPAPTPPPAPTHTPAPTPSPTPTPAPKPAPTPAPRPAPTPSTSCASEWQQCGGKDFQGPTCCSDGFACIISSEYYSQCRPTDHSKNAGPVANKHTDHSKSVGQKSHKQKFLGVVDISLDDDGSLLQLPETCVSE